MAENLKSTVLHPAHAASPGARLVEFGGYEMPVQYADGIMAEHRWTRDNAGAFDVSHMGPCFFELVDKSGDADADHAAIAAIVETLVPGDIAGLKPGQIRYSVLLNADGGMIDDLMIGRPFRPDRQGALYIVVNAGGKEADFALFEQAAAGKATLRRADDRALIAVQGPKAIEAVAAILPDAAQLTFMHFRRFDYQGHGVIAARSGYTGEDGFEILVPAEIAIEVWNRLLADERVKPIGLGARDSLRLEAGLPLYGHDADETVSPIEANLGFAVSKRRRREANFPGAARIEREVVDGPSRLRVGLLVEGAPAREGAEIADASGAIIGKVTSGGFSPSLNRPIAMGFVPPALSAPGTKLSVVVRGRSQPAEVTSLPFVPHRYVRKVLETV
jgi:aminomethyltransferase